MEWTKNNDQMVDQMGQDFVSWNVGVVSTSILKLKLVFDFMDRNRVPFFVGTLNACL